MDQPRPRLTDAINDGMTDRINKLGRTARCQPLSWSISAYDERTIRGLAGSGDYAAEDVADVLAGWAAMWSLTRVERPVCAGSIEYHGQIDNLAVQVWGVHDRDAFEREAEQDRQAWQARQQGGQQ